MWSEPQIGKWLQQRKTHLRGCSKKYAHRTGLFRITLAAFLACVGSFCFGLVFCSIIEGFTGEGREDSSIRGTLGGFSQDGTPAPAPAGC